MYNTTPKRPEPKISLVSVEELNDALRSRLAVRMLKLRAHNGQTNLAGKVVREKERFGLKSPGQKAGNKAMLNY